MKPFNKAEYTHGNFTVQRQCKKVVTSVSTKAAPEYIKDLTLATKKLIEIKERLMKETIER